MNTIADLFIDDLLQAAINRERVFAKIPSHKTVEDYRKDTKDAEDRLRQARLALDEYIAG